MFFAVVGPGVALIAIGAALAIVVGTLTALVTAVVVAVVFGWTRRRA